ncbi:hypothetical protein MRX96_056811 [Rhipicephalus microplus]
MMSPRAHDEKAVNLLALWTSWRWQLVRRVVAGLRAQQHCCFAWAGSQVLEMAIRFSGRVMVRIEGDMAFIGAGDRPVDKCILSRPLLALWCSLYGQITRSCKMLKVAINC